VKRSKFTVQQIAYALRQAAMGHQSKTRYSAYLTPAFVAAYYK
jgi:hypothetical protein